MGMTRFVFVVGEKYQIERKLGGGSFGDVFLGKNIEDGCRVAIKLEPTSTRHPQLEGEATVYRELSASEGSSNSDADTKQRRGVPRIYFYGSEGDYRVLVMERLGPSLDDLLNYCGGSFSLKTVLMITDQCVCAPRAARPALTV